MATLSVRMVYSHVLIRLSLGYLTYVLILPKNLPAITNGGKLFATVYILVAGTVLINSTSPYHVAQHGVVY